MMLALAGAAAASPRPDLSGVWVISNRSTRGYLDSAGRPLQALPLTPSAAAMRAKADPALDPSARCLTMFPRLMSWPYPIQVVQTGKLVVILFEADTTYRAIYVDGRPPDPDDDPAWLGHSAGRWQGDTLVVETRGVKDEAWLDADGVPVSDALHVTERFRLFDGGRSLEDLMTIEDPKVLAAPVSRRLVYNLKPAWRLKEYVCEEGNRDDADHPRPGNPGSLKPAAPTPTKEPR